MCSFGDLDPATIWEEEPAIMSRATYKGRLHECDGCGLVIKRGDPYLRHSNLYEGSWTREKMCFWCWWTRKVFADAHEGMLFQPSALWETLQECIGENDDDEDPWRWYFATLKRRFRMSPAGRRQATRKREERRRRRGRTSWSLRAGDDPPFPMPDAMRRGWFR